MTHIGIGPEDMNEHAFAAFKAREYLLIVGDRQIADLNEAVFVTSGLQVTFLQLSLLRAG